MNKVGPVAIVVGMIIAAYLLLLVVMPVLVDFSIAANTTAAASSDMSRMPGASETLIAAPWVLLFVPAGIGMIVIVVILKRR